MSLNILQWNIRNFSSNKTSLNLLVESTSPHIICLQETWSRPSDVPKLAGYNLVSRKDRMIGRGGGVSIFASSAIPIVPLNLHSPLEVCGAKVLTPSQPFSIISLYIPPSPIDDLESKINDLINSVPSPLIICTDGNGHHHQWGSPQDNPRGSLLKNCITSNNLEIPNSGEPTFETPHGTFTHLDLSITSPSLAPSLDWKVYQDNLQSDHFPIIINFPSLQITLSQNIPKFKIKKADWFKFQKSLTLPSPPFTNPDETCQKLEDSLLQAAQISIPQTSATYQPKFN